MDEQNGLPLAAPINDTPQPLLLASTAVPSVTLPEDVANDRALKARTAYPQLGLDTKQIVDQIKSGNEQAFRTQVATTLDAQRSMQTAAAIQGMAGNLNRPLTLPESLLIQDMVKQKQTNPDSVIEEGYAEKFMENLRQQALKNPDSDIGRAFQNTPTQVEKDMQTGKDYFAMRQRIQTLYENAQAAGKQQSLFGDVVDFAKGLTGFYEQAKLRGLQPNSSIIQYGLGRNIEEQAKGWFHMPFEEFNDKITKVANKLINDNPSLAQYYLGALLEQSKSEQLLHSVMPALDLTIAGDLAKGSKALFDGLRGIGVNRTALKQMMTTITKATPEGAANAVGDATEAGVLQAATSLINRMQGSGKPLSEELQRLQSIYTEHFSQLGDLQRTRPNPEFIGPMPAHPDLLRSIGQETANRVEDELTRWSPRVFQEIQDAMKIDQVPAAFAVRDNIEKIVKGIARDYPGWENAIHDTRFELDGLGNLHSVTYFGRNGTELFASEKEALAAQRANFNKVGNASIVEADPQLVRKTIKGKPGEAPPSLRTETMSPEERWQLALTNPEESLRRRTALTAESKAEPLARHPSDVFVGELDDRELKAATTGKDTYNKGELYKDLGHTMEIDDRIPTNTSVELVQKGAGWYIVHKAPYDVTSPEMRMSLLATSDAKTPMSAVNAFGGWLGKLRTPEDTLSREQNFARKVATYAPAGFKETQKELLQEINDLLPKWKIPGLKKNEVWKQWKTVMDYAMSSQDAVTGKAEGLLPFRSVGELGDLYLQKLNRVPSPAEVSASFRLKAFYEFSQSFNLIREFNRQTRLGAETWTFSTGNVARESNRNSSGGSFPYKEIKANGILQHEVPSSDKENVLLLGLRETDSKVVKASTLPKSVQEEVSAGRSTIVRLTDPTAFPFSRIGSVGDELVHYVYAPQLETGKPLAARGGSVDWNTLRTGTPARYDYDHYVVQPNFHYSSVSDVHSYLGDTTIAAFNIRAMGRDVAYKLNEIRKLIAADNLPGARAYHGTSGLEQPFDEIHSWFKTDVSPDGLNIRPKLNLQDDIVLVPHGKTTLDMGKDLERKYGDKFKDMTREYYGHTLDDRRDPFDVFTYKNAGSKDSPLYQKTPVKYIDPLTTLNRGMNRAINGMFMDTYKQMSIEHWIQEVKDHVTVKDIDLASSPEYWFYTLSAENHWKGGTPDIVKNNLLTANMQIRQFLGVQDKMDTWLHQTAQTLADSFYRVAPGMAQKDTGLASYIAPTYLLPKLRDPTAFVRAMAFHAKLGLFAIPQLMVQASTFAFIMGVAGPDHAAAGAKAALFHSWTRINKSPEILDHLDGMVATNIVPGSKWLPGQFKEANQLFSRSGFEHIGNEHMFTDSSNYYDFFGSKLQGFLDAGSWFFREGERQVRTGAFYTAYREVRDQLTHTGPLTAAEERAVLQRADQLSVNMSRASASMIHKGVFSVPTQFMSYTLRLAEQIWSKRLTDIEKARVFAVYSTLYGVPAAFGLSGLPLGDVINKTALANGYQPGSPENSFLNNAVTEGLPALGLSLISGNWYNVGDRYANPGGISVIKDLIRGDKSFLETIVGAPFSIASNAIGSVDPFINMTLSAVRGDGQFKPKVEDFTGIFNEVNSAYSALRFIGAVNTHRWLSKNEGYLADVSTPNAIFMTLTGLQPRELSDIQNIQWSKEQEKKAQDVAIQKFVTESQRSYRERQNGNVDQADDYQRRAWSWLRWGDVPPDRFSEALAMAAQGGYKDIINRTKTEYYSRHVPPSRQGAALEGAQKFRSTKYGNQ
jgi:hypothetical protein